MSFGISSMEISGVFGPFGSTSPQPRHLLHPSIIGALWAICETATNKKATVSNHFMTAYVYLLLCKNNTDRLITFHSSVKRLLSWKLRHELSSVKSAADVTISLHKSKMTQDPLSSFRSCVFKYAKAQIDDANNLFLFLVIYVCF